jgi:prophage regulatory protein
VRQRTCFIHECIFKNNVLVHLFLFQIFAYDAVIMFSAAAIADQPVPSRIIRLPEVLHRTGLSKSTLYSRMKEGMFPRQVRYSTGSHDVGWWESEIDEYIASLIDARPDPPVRTTSDDEVMCRSCLQTVPLQYPVPSGKGIERSPQKIKPKLISSTLELRKTGMEFEGYDEVYVQETTGKLFVKIGQMPASLAAILVA